MRDLERLVFCPSGDQQAGFLLVLQLLTGPRNNGNAYQAKDRVRLPFINKPNSGWCFVEYGTIFLILAV